MSSPPSLPLVKYIADAAVDDTLDLALRDLLSTCFTGPTDDVFRRRRYFREPPAHRWIMPAGPALAAHAAVHEKTVSCGGVEHSIGGIAEVCVHPGFRGRGCVRQLLSAVHPWLAARGFVHAVLFGQAAVYSSSGYFPVANLHMADSPSEPAAGAMAHPLGGAPWPCEAVLLHGPRF